MAKFNTIRNRTLFTFDGYEGTSKENHIFIKGVYTCPETGRECNAYCKKHNYYLVCGDLSNVTIIE